MKAEHRQITQIFLSLRMHPPPPAISFLAQKPAFRKCPKIFIIWRGGGALIREIMLYSYCQWTYLITTEMMAATKTYLTSSWLLTLCVPTLVATPLFHLQMGCISSNKYYNETCLERPPLMLKQSCLSRQVELVRIPITDENFTNGNAVFPDRVVFLDWVQP